MTVPDWFTAEGDPVYIETPGGSFRQVGVAIDPPEVLVIQDEMTEVTRHLRDLRSQVTWIAAAGRVNRENITVTFGPVRDSTMSHVSEATYLDETPEGDIVERIDGALDDWQYPWDDAARWQPDHDADACDVDEDDLPGWQPIGIIQRPGMRVRDPLERWVGIGAVGTENSYGPAFSHYVNPWTGAVYQTIDPSSALLDLRDDGQPGTLNPYLEAARRYAQRRYESVDWVRARTTLTEETRERIRIAWWEWCGSHRAIDLTLPESLRRALNTEPTEGD